MKQDAPLTPTTPVAYAKGVGPARAEQLQKLEVRTCGDLLTYYPRDYLRYSPEAPVAALKPGELATARGVILQTRMIRRRPARFEALLDDGSQGGKGGRCVLTWFHPYGLDKKIQPGMRVRVTGKVTLFRDRLQMAQPRYEVLPESESGSQDGDPTLADAKIEAVYPATEELTTQQIGRIIHANMDFLLSHVDEWFPEPHLRDRQLFTRREAFELIHRPRRLEEAYKARRTLAYHEFFLHQSAVAIKRYHQRTSQPAVPLRVDDRVDARIRALLPFALTPAQERVIESIKKDLANVKPMNRLLQGDVGSGKTVVALYAMLCAIATPLDPPESRASDAGLNAPSAAPSFLGHQAALMAPTEVLAEQHYLTLLKFLEGKKVRIGLLVGGQPASERQEILRSLADGSLGLVVGTHALLTENVNFRSLALIVIDEQHKFGVEQRSIIRSKRSESGAAPHTLVMTATPIPRTLAMTAFGDLDVSVIDELPPGRVPIHTKMTPSANREVVYAFVAERLKAGEQAYVVVPTIDEGELDLRSATSVQEELQKEWLKDFRVGLLHGRMARDTRQHIMERFRQRLIDVLVSTTVIEVGVDVPNATVMVIEHADRFGLSQLHQLRGRVGRSTRKSYCVLLGDQATEDGIKRLQAMVKFASGFKIAEEDLKLRGMGQIIGTAQSGRTNMAFADLLFDTGLLMMSRRDAFAMVAADPRMLAPEHRVLRAQILGQFGDSISLADVG